MTPVEDFMYLLNSVLLGEEPTIEDFILLVGTCVAFIAFVLWCCFPIVPKESNAPVQYDPRSCNQYKKLDTHEHSSQSDNNNNVCIIATTDPSSSSYV